jgi:hypothetical protein
MANTDLFQSTLEKHYSILFETDPDYGYAISIGKTPASLAAAMTNSLAKGGANKDGEGIKRTCKELKIKHTYKALAAFFSA